MNFNESLRAGLNSPAAWILKEVRYSQHNVFIPTEDSDALFFYWEKKSLSSESTPLFPLAATEGSAVHWPRCQYVKRLRLRLSICRVASSSLYSELYVEDYIVSSPCWVRCTTRLGQLSLVPTFTSFINCVKKYSINFLLESISLQSKTSLETVKSRRKRVYSKTGQINPYNIPAGQRMESILRSADSLIYPPLGWFAPSLWWTSLFLPINTVPQLSFITVLLTFYIFISDVISATLCRFSAKQKFLQQVHSKFTQSITTRGWKLTIDLLISN